jgi:hypothetical protein
MDNSGKSMTQPKTDVAQLPESQFQEYIGPKEQDIRPDNQTDSRPIDLMDRVNTNRCNDWSTVLPPDGRTDQNLHNLHPVSGFAYKHESIPSNIGDNDDHQNQLNHKNVVSGHHDKPSEIIDEKGDYVLPEVLPDYNEQWAKDEPMVFHNAPGVSNFDNYDPENWNMKPKITTEETQKEIADLNHTNQLIHDLLDSDVKPEETSTNVAGPIEPIAKTSQKNFINLAVEGIMNTAKSVLVTATSAIDKAFEKVSDAFADIIIEDPFALPGDAPDTKISDAIRDELFPAKAEIQVPDVLPVTESAGQQGFGQKVYTSDHQRAITDNANDPTTEFQDAIAELEEEHQSLIRKDEIKIAETRPR